MLFPEKLKTLRKEKGLSQAELAKAINLGRSCISMLEIGKNEPTIGNLYLIADFFECTIDYLVGRTDDFGNIVIQNEKKSPASVLTAEEEKLLKGFRSLSPGTQAMIMRVLSGAIETEKKIN